MHRSNAALSVAISVIRARGGVGGNVTKLHFPPRTESQHRGTRGTPSSRGTPVRYSVLLSTSHAQCPGKLRKYCKQEDKNKLKLAAKIKEQQNIAKREK
jgi:hypothetical protein